MRPPGTRDQRIILGVLHELACPSMNLRVDYCSGGVTWRGFASLPQLGPPLPRRIWQQTPPVPAHQVVRRVSWPTQPGRMLCSVRSSSRVAALRSVAIPMANMLTHPARGAGSLFDGLADPVHAPTAPPSRCTALRVLAAARHPHLSTLAHCRGLRGPLAAITDGQAAALRLCDDQVHCDSLNCLVAATHIGRCWERRPAVF